MTEAALAVLCGALAAALAIPGTQLLTRIWQQSEFFGHGYLIPLASLLLLYTNRDEIALAWREGRAPLLGFAWVFASSAFLILAVLGDVATAAGAGVPLLWLATAYALRGLPLLRATAIPFGLLLFSVPPPGFILDVVLVDLKLLVTRIAVLGLHALDEPVAATGNTLLVPDGELFVADACSGISSVVTLLPLAVIVARFLSHGVWRRILLLASVIPLAMLGNIFRVVLTVWLVNRGHLEFAQGLLHEAFGTTTYIAGTLALLGLAKVIR